MRKRIKVILAGTAAAGILAVSGFAFADFLRTSGASANNEAVKFETITVTAAADAQALLPGETSSVTLTINNPNAIKAKVVEIKPKDVDGVVVDPASLDNGDDADYCEGLITLTPSGTLPTLNANGTASVVMNNAVKLEQEMDIRCEGMKVATNWEVKFQAVRA